MYLIKELFTHGEAVKPSADTRRDTFNWGDGQGNDKALDKLMPLKGKKAVGVEYDADLLQMLCLQAALIE